MSKQQKQISKKALKEFLSEAEEIIEKLNQDLFRLEEENGDGAIDPDLLNEVFRSAHTLKGLSGMFGFSNMMSLSHNLENMLDKLRLGKIRLTSSRLNLLVASVDLLRKLVEQSSAGGEDQSGKDVGDMISRLDASITEESCNLKTGPLESLKIDPDTLNVLTEYEEHRLVENIRLRKRIFRVQVKFDLLTFDQSLNELTAQLKQVGEVITTLPSANPSKETEIEFEIIVGSERGERELREALGRLDARLLEVPYRDAEARGDAGDQDRSLGTEGGPTRERQRERSQEDVSTLKSLSETVRVDIGKLDHLMNLAGELGLLRTNLMGLAHRLSGEPGQTGPASDLGKIAKRLDRKLSDLQAGVMDVRMVPLRHVFDKLSRIARKSSRDAGKSVRLVVEGADTELDKLIIEELVDPLMHIVRNAIDHGIEPVPERIATGKPGEGTIRIGGAQRGNHVVIEIADDGRGIQMERIHDLALKTGLVQKGVELSKREMLDLILTPGFSTKTEVTEMSGRGVGLDVVKENIARLSGIIDIDSAPGRGTQFSIMLPITLAIIQALLVEVSGRSYAVPLNSVLECLMVRKEEIRTVEGHEVIQLRDTILPLVRLDVIFELGGKGKGQEKCFVVVVGLAEHRIGIVVDRLQGRQDIVLKSLGKLLRKVRGIAGATELGDQQTILVVDIAALVEESIHRSE